MLTRVDYNHSIEKNKICQKSLPDSEVYPNIEEKIEEIFTLVNKYFQGIENLDDETEKKLIEETLFRYEETYMNNSAVDDQWAVINICK